MMQKTFPKNCEVFITNCKCCNFMLALSLTVTNQLTYIDDPADTLEQWIYLKCNGIDNKDDLTIVAVGHMLDMTDSNNIELDTVIPSLFNAVPILKHY